jgi:signal recognition particle receptor subunit alpha
LENELDLVFVVVYQKLYQLLWLDEFLQHVKREFVTMFKEELSQTCCVYGKQAARKHFAAFEPKFDSLRQEAEKSRIKRSTSSSKVSRSPSGSSLNNGTGSVKGTDGSLLAEEAGGDDDDKEGWTLLLLLLPSRLPHTHMSYVCAVGLPPPPPHSPPFKGGNRVVMTSSD